MTLKSLQQYERTVCDCDSCRDTYCLGRPGQCDPTDMDRMADASGVSDEPAARTAWMYKNFVASEDGFNPKGNGANRMCCIRPRVKDGQCVFYDRERNKCKVWHCAPFECTRCRACHPDESHEAMQHCAEASCTIAMTLAWHSMKTAQSQ
jgi:hypothetical protein